MPVFTRCAETQETSRELSLQNGLVQLSDFEDEVTESQRAKVLGDPFHR